MTYRQRDNYEPLIAPETESAPVRPLDAWQWLGVAAGALALLLLLGQIAGLFGFPLRFEHPFAVMLLAFGGGTLLAYRSTGGILGDASPALRRGLGLAQLAPALMLLLAEWLA